jgi:hypothetical protein
VVKSLKSVLKSSRELAVHYDMGMKRDLEAMFNMLSSPPSLQDICRRHIRACLSVPIQQRVQALPLAQRLKDFVCMADVFSGWDEDDRLAEEMRFKPLAFGAGWRGNVQPTAMPQM